MVAVTYCSKSYEDSLRLCLPWWFKCGGIDRAIIYTDCEDLNVGEYNDKVTVVPMFSPSEDWLVSVGRQPEVACHYAENAPDGQGFVFMGTDCLTIRDITDGTKDLSGIQPLGVIRYWDVVGKTPVNHCFGIVTYGLRVMFEKWKSLSKEFKRDGVGIKPGFTAFDQFSYAAVVSFYHGASVKLSWQKYMNEHDDPIEWAKEVGELKEGVHCLHFKGGRWKDMEMVDAMIRIAGVETAGPLMGLPA